MKKHIYIKEIISAFKEEIIDVKGSVEDVIVDNVADEINVTTSTLDWVNKSKINKQEIAENSVARVVVVDPSVSYSSIIEHKKKVLIFVKNPRKVMAKIITEFFLSKNKPGIHPTAVIDEDAIISPNVTIGPGCVVGKAEIGQGTVLKPNVVIYDDVNIGENCLIQAGAVIGTDGLGCMRESDGTLIKFPHLGGVRILDNVEIGANCQIAKGVLSDTIIKNGCKINGLCFIAHNCVLEENVWITGDTMLCGTTHVGRNSTIFSNVIIRDQVSLGEHTTIGMGSVVTKNVPAGETWVGCPARKIEKNNC